MCVGGLERFQRLRVPILAEFDQHLFRRYCRDGRCNRLVSKAIDASPEGTLGTGPAHRIVEALLVRATDDPVGVDRVLDPLTVQPVRHFGCDLLDRSGRRPRRCSTNASDSDTSVLRDGRCRPRASSPAYCRARRQRWSQAGTWHARTMEASMRLIIRRASVRTNQERRGLRAR